jgi:hypothetical protein
MNVRPGAAGSDAGNLMTSDLPFGTQSTSQRAQSGTGGPPAVGTAIVTWEPACGSAGCTLTINQLPSGEVVWKNSTGC